MSKAKGVRKKASKDEPLKLGKYELSPAEEQLAGRWKQRHKEQVPAPKLKIEHPDHGPASLEPDHESQTMWYIEFWNAFGTTNRAFADMLLNQLLQVDFEPGGERLTPKFVNGSLAAIHSIAPRDETEAMLATQMVAAHHAAMECYRRAMIPEQSFQGLQGNLNYAGRLSRTYVGLLEALNRYRGKAQQKMTVEHIHVHEGGQAIVGTVSHNRGGSDAENAEQSHAPSRTDEPGTQMRRKNTKRASVPPTSRKR